MILQRIVLLLLLSWTAPLHGQQERFASLFKLTDFDFADEHDSMKFVGMIQNRSFWSVNRFMAGNIFDSCRRNLQNSNQDGDYELSPDEYSTFIELESNGKISVPFAEMRLILIATYYAVACNQCYDNNTTESDNCCVGNSATIIIKRSDAERYAQTTRFLCATVQQAIADALAMPTTGPSMSMEPTIAPMPSAATVQPVSAPQPSASATDVPTTQAPQPSASVTKVPTEMPATQPSTAATSEPKPSLTATVTPVAETLQPTPAPSTAKPIRPPTASPTKIPTALPTPAPTTPLPTVKPTPTPTTAPMQAPTTPLPTAKPTPAPTTAPVQAPTTPLPTAKPTSAPTTAPVQAPTTPSPTAKPTRSPTKTPTRLPTASPTRSPTTSPVQLTQAPTNKPTLAPTLYPENNVSCVTFFYSIQNSAGFSANDILTETGNTLKTGLEAATYQTLVILVNATASNATNASGATTPRQRRTTTSRVRSRRTQQQIISVTEAIRHFYTVGPTHAMDNAIASYYAVDDADRLLDEVLYGLYTPKRDGGKSQRQLAASEPDGRGQLNRQLAYATSALRPNITGVIQDPFCPQPDQATLECAIVVTDVCFILEQGDNEAAVQQTILSGFQQALNSGDFFARVPSENLIT